MHFHLRLRLGPVTHLEVPSGEKVHSVAAGNAQPTLVMQSSSSSAPQRVVTLGVLMEELPRMHGGVSGMTLSYQSGVSKVEYAS
jgi:hypothetical protein